MAVRRVPDAVGSGGFAVPGELQDPEQQRAQHRAADDIQQHPGAALLLGPFTAAFVFPAASAGARVVASDFHNPPSLFWVDVAYF